MKAHEVISEETGQSAGKTVETGSSKKAVKKDFKKVKLQNGVSLR